MCYAAAIPIVTLLISAAATAYTVDQSNQGVKAENKSREVASESAAQSGRNQFSEINQRVQQEQEAVVQAKMENAKRAAEARSTARTSSGQAGVAGLSVDSLLADFYRQEAGYRAVTDANLVYTIDQSQRQAEGVRSGTQSRINELRPEPLPGYLGAGMRIAGQSVQAYDQYQTYTNPKWKGA